MFLFILPSGPIKVFDLDHWPENELGDRKLMGGTNQRSDQT